jgi:hypothetical protein
MRKSKKVVVTGQFHGKPLEFRVDVDELANAKGFLDKLIASPPVSGLCGKGVDLVKLVEFFLLYATDDGEFWEHEALSRVKEIKAAHSAFKKFLSALQPICGLPGLSDFKKIEREEHCASLLAYIRLIEKRPKHRASDEPENFFILGLAEIVKRATHRFYDGICHQIFELTFSSHISPESYRIRRERLSKDSQRKSRLSVMAKVDSQSQA